MKIFFIQGESNFIPKSLNGTSLDHTSNMFKKEDYMTHSNNIANYDVPYGEWKKNIWSNN